MAAETVEDGTHEYTLTIAEVTNADVIMLAIDGVQEASDVFLFDPLNGYKASQSMAGYDDSALPVHAETTVEPEMMPETEPETIQETEQEIESEAKSESTTEETESVTMSEKTPQVPNTGEVAEAGITFWLVVAVISCTGIGLMLLIKRHRERL